MSARVVLQLLDLVPEDWAVLVCPVITFVTIVDVASSIFRGAPSTDTSNRCKGFVDAGHGIPNLILPPDLHG